MASIIPFIFSQFFDNNGDPLAEGTLTFYAAGTETPQDTYSDAEGETENQNPLELNSSGRSGPIFFSSSPYDIVLKDSLGNVVGTLSDVAPAGGETTGSYTTVLTGCSATISGTVYWTKRGSIVSLLIPLLTGTSNNAAATLTGLPASLWPPSIFGYQSASCNVKTSDGDVLGLLYIDHATGVIVLLNKSVITAAFSTTWPATGVKQIGSTIGNFLISYMVS